MALSFYGIPLLEEAMQNWQSLSEFRRERTRNKNYTFGRQWCDVISVNGRRMTEYDYIVSEGSLPLKNNLIRRIVRNVVGVFRRQLAEKMEGWSEPLQQIAAHNRMYELLSRTMEEFLISGMAVHKVWHSDGQPVACDSVSPQDFFFDKGARDLCGRDANLVGQLHDLSFPDYCDAFVHTQEDYERIATRCNSGEPIRVVEIWRHERVGRHVYHDSRKGSVIVADDGVKLPREIRSLPSSRHIADVWRYYFIDSEGRILSSGDSPLPDGGHPFVFKCYPFLDGEIHSFVADIIDQQRYTNRLITMYDWIMRASAKGVLLMPEGAVDPENMQNVVDQWSRFNGVIVYRPRPGYPDPKQVSGNATNIGISELLDIQLKMLEDVSGVNGALQGNLANNSISGTLYNQQTQNALISLSDLLDTFASFISEITTKLTI